MFINKEEISFRFEKALFSLSDFRLQTLSKPYPIHYHSENSYEIHFVKSGKGTLVVNSKSYELGPNSLFVTGPFINHGQIPDASDPLIKYSIYFTIIQSSYSMFLSLFLKNTFWIGNDSNNCLEIFESIKKELEEKKLGYQNLVEELLKILIIRILRNYNVMLPQSKTEKSYTDTIFEIESIFLNEFTTITLMDLAKRLYISQRQLQRFLMTHYKKNFNTLKLEARMSYASNALKHSMISISDLSQATGYSSPEHFSLAFKKYYGTTPLKYKKAFIKEISESTLEKN